MEFLSDNWISLLFYLALFGIFMFLINFTYKIALGFLVLSLVLIFLFDFTPKEVFNLGKDLTHQAGEIYTDSIEPVINKELEDATLEENPDGSFLIRSASVEISGNKNEDSAQLVFKEKTYDLDMQVAKELIQKVKLMQEPPTNS